MKLARIQAITIKYIVISSVLVLALMSSVLTLNSLLTPKAAYAQINPTTDNSNTSSARGGGSSNSPGIITSSSHIDSGPVVAVFVITKDNQGNLIFLPNSASIRAGEEMLVLNNDTKPQTLLNGKGSNDPLSGKLFSIGAIKPKAFLEYGASSLQDGKYPFYLQSDVDITIAVDIATKKRGEDAI